MPSAFAIGAKPLVCTKFFLSFEGNFSVLRQASKTTKCVAFEASSRILLVISLKRKDRSQNVSSSTLVTSIGIR